VPHAERDSPRDGTAPLQQFGTVRARIANPHWKFMLMCRDSPFEAQISPKSYLKLHFVPKRKITNVSPVQRSVG
jgi:hypothetical protein